MKTTLWAVTAALCLTTTGVWAAGEEEGAAAGPREMIEDPTTGKMLLAPRYGGSISYAAIGSPPSSDMWFASQARYAVDGLNESLAIGNWGTPRDIFAFDTDVLPAEVITGQLAESWEQRDPMTIVFNIRPRVRWHDKPPVNGRQLTAHDVAYNWNRYFGLGQFVEQGPSSALGIQTGIFESVTATDDLTVVFELAKPRLDPLYYIFQPRPIYAPEVIKQYGNVRDWRNNVGTGPFELVERMEGRHMTWTKNEDYWGFDEKFPENRLPYVDVVRAIIMKEPATRLAAIRTGRVDHLGSLGNSQINSIDDFKSLSDSNPKLQFFPHMFRCETCIGFNIANKPFDDINVRRAMQMAFDFEAMNNDFFYGQADWEPEGLIGRGSKAGYFTPMSEWPEEIAQYYRYDPERAEQLLDRAGYPRGDDGIRFRTHYDVWGGRPLPFFDLQIAYWRDIGVEVEVRPHDSAALVSLIQNRAYEGMSGRESGFFTGDPLRLLRSLAYTDATWNAPGIDDPELNALLDEATDTTDLAEHQRLVKEADLYITANHWYMWSHRIPDFSVFQPWIFGYSGEIALGKMGLGLTIIARLWNDEEQKEEMRGYTFPAPPPAPARDSIRYPKASRHFTGPNDNHHEKEYAVHGVVAFRSRPSNNDDSYRQYHDLCRAYVLSMDHIMIVGARVETIDQMVTAWPISNQSVADDLNQRSKIANFDESAPCDDAVRNVDTQISGGYINSVNDALQSSGHTRRVEGRGPFLIAWTKGFEKVMIFDLSSVQTYNRIKMKLEDWAQRIEDPEKWKDEPRFLEGSGYLIDEWGDRVFGYFLKKLFGE